LLKVLRNSSAEYTTPINEVGIFCGTEVVNAMIFPLDLTGLNILLGVAAAILLIASELLSTRSPKLNLLIDGRKLRQVAILMSIFFLVTILLRIYYMIAGFQ
jgi:hypothetical protein